MALFDKSRKPIAILDRTVAVKLVDISEAKSK